MAIEDTQGLKNQVKFVTYFTNFGYIVGCIILYLIAMSIIGTSIYSIYTDFFSPDYSVYHLLDEVALLVFSIAVLDVFKYLMVEEVIRQPGDREPIEVRRALTKFSVIIATALALEGLVLTIEVAKSDVTKILYPIGLLIVSTFFIIATGVYQKFNASAEKK